MDKVWSTVQLAVVIICFVFYFYAFGRDGKVDLFLVGLHCNIYFKTVFQNLRINLV